MPEEDETRSRVAKYYVDGDKLDPTEIIGPALMDIETVEAILPQSDKEGALVGSRDCFRLFYAVAHLRFTDWDYVEMLWTPERKQGVMDATARTYQALADVVGRHRAAIVECLDQGIRDKVSFIESGLKNPHICQEPYEFSSEIMFPYDMLGFIRLLLNSLGLELPLPTQSLIDRLDTSMKQSLPGIAATFREAGDAIDPVEPRMYPASFWWTRLHEE